MEVKQAFFVKSTDGRKFKMVIRGELGKISVSKIRRYLRSYGVPDGHILTYKGHVLSDDMLGEDFGLESDEVMELHEGVPAVEHSQPVQGPPSEVSDEQPTRRSRDRVGPQQAWEEVTSHIHGGRPVVPVDASPPDLYRQNSELKEELARVRAALERSDAERASIDRHNGSRRIPSSHTDTVGMDGGSTTDPLQNAKDNLQNLALRLGTPLRFDGNLTCVVGTEKEFTVLVTYDPATERLYTYSTLLTYLPKDPTVRVKLYEVLLEGSLLGREVCGGGIGLSLQNNVVVLSTSLMMGHSNSTALREMLPSFVESLMRWRSLINELLE